MADWIHDQFNSWTCTGLIQLVVMQLMDATSHRFPVNSCEETGKNMVGKKL
jgi:hypothetical protein